MANKCLVLRHMFEWLAHDASRLATTVSELAQEMAPS